MRVPGASAALLAAVAAGVVLLAALPGAEARVNATSAFDTLAITDCEKCIEDEDSVQIKNATLIQHVNLAQNKDSAPGKFCWAGTFGKVLDNQGNFTKGLLGSREWVYVNLTCKIDNVYYNQCIIAAPIAIALMVIGFIVFTSAVTVVCICFGFCRCGTEDDVGCCKICKAKFPGGKYICACVTDLEDPRASAQAALVVDRALMEKSAMDLEREEEERKKAEAKFGVGKKKKKGSSASGGSEAEMPAVENPLAGKTVGNALM